MSYCASLGDMSGQPVAGNDTSLSGKRLTSFIGGNEVLENTHFRPNGITFTDCQNLESLILTNSDNLSGSFTDDASNMVRLRELKLRGTRYTSVSLTATDRLETIELPSNIDSIVMTAQPNLTNFSIDSVDKLESIKNQAIQIAKEVGMASTDVVNSIADTIQTGGYAMKEAIEIARQTMMLANVGEMSQESATEGVVAMLSGFKMQPLKEVTRVVDGATKSTNQLTDAMDQVNYVG